MGTIKPCSGCGNYPGFCTCTNGMKVYAPCVSTFIKVGDVNILNVSEGPQGEDIATYECSQCDKVHDSRVVKGG